MTDLTAIVCGGRDYADEPTMRAVLCRLVEELRIDRIVTGGARGADTIALELALEGGLAMFVEHADWNKHGRAAGPLRNQRMLDRYPVSVVVAFPGGNGTADMVRRSIAAGVPFVIVVAADGRYKFV